MTRPKEEKSEHRRLPRAILVKKYWPHPLIWLIPILAASVALFYFVDQNKNRGPEITISFKDGSGLKADNTTIEHLGVDIGAVTGMELSPDQGSVLVHVRLNRAAGAFANKGAVFWIVRPQINAGSISGLSTITSGPYIEAVPGNGEPRTEFTGLETEPNALGEGLRIILHAPRLEHLQADSAVTYRGIQVGVIHDVQLSADANGIDVQTFIWDRYRSLVHLNSCFWVVSGADVNGGILTGVHVKLDSLKSLISGGVEFATPDAAGDDKTAQPATAGAQFPLYDEPKKDWLDWAPRIPLPKQTVDQQDPAINPPEAADSAPNVVKVK